MTKLIIRLILVAALSGTAVMTVAAPAEAGSRNATTAGVPGGR